MIELELVLKSSIKTTVLKVYDGEPLSIVLDRPYHKIGDVSIDGDLRVSSSGQPDGTGICHQVSLMSDAKLPEQGDIFCVQEGESILKYNFDNMDVFLSTAREFMKHGESYKINITKK